MATFNGVPIIGKTENLTQRYAYDVNGNLEYAGQALPVPGLQESDAAWAIQKFSYDGDENLVSIKQASGRLNVFSHQWSDRENLEYV
ncbi:MAG: hypothetical protein HQL86_00480 [Magnetococcales bacterium]|nr:hypothetical protein [Magnetococcales bacterium]